MSELEENVKNLSECLQAVVARVEKLESFHGVNSPKPNIPSSRNRQENQYQEVNGETVSNDVKSVVTKEDHAEPDGTTRHVTRTVTTAVVKSAAFPKAGTQPGSAVDGPQFESLPEVTSGLSYMDENRPFEIYRTVGFRKAPGMHLGVTTRESSGRVLISGVDSKSPVGKNVKPGDVVVEVNGKAVHSPAEFDKAVEASAEGVTLKLIPISQDHGQDQESKGFYRSRFDYNPLQDTMLKTKEVGLPFKAGDVLEVIDDTDKDWWQAKRVDDNSRVGIVPSKKLVEKQKGGTYDEVGRLSPYGRRVLVILGAPGVGRRTLKGRLLRHDPELFATIVPCTSRQPRNGEVNLRDYTFLEKNSMEKAIKDGNYVEWGELRGNYYGTTLDSVRKIIQTGKLCVLDCSPQGIRHLHNTEFMPFVVFISPPPIDELRQLYSGVMASSLKKKTDAELQKTVDESKQMEANFKQYFDLSLVNRNSEVTFRRLLDALENIKTQPQWVPITWFSRAR